MATHSRTNIVINDQLMSDAMRATGLKTKRDAVELGTLIATRCIADGLTLLYTDRDFDPFVDHLGLTTAIRSRS